MSNQTKVTDFFVHQKKTDKTLRSAKKINSDVFDATDKSLATESSATEQTIPTIKTPKRKKATTSDKSLRSSKRKKTPKSDVIIEFKPNVSEVKEEEKTASNDSVRAEKSDKQLSAKEVKEKLIKCNNLLKLKQGLLTINDCSTKLKQFKEIKVPTPTKKPIRTPTKNRSPAKFSPIRPILSTTPITPIPPLKSPVRMTPNKNSDCVQTYRRCLIKVFEEESPKKSDKKESLRAFERFSYLVRKPEENKTLVLPLKYQVLANMFKAMDTIVSMYYKRQEVCTFDKVKDSVQLMTNKKFDMKRLAQIQSIFSEAFKLKYELFSGFGFNNRKPAYQLIISPVYNSNVDIRHNSSHLLERYQMFVDKLLDIAKRHHKNYLNNLGITINDDELFRWHPKFCLDSVPDIEPNDNALPTEPKFGEHSAETFLENSRQRLGIHSTAEQKTADTNDNQIADNKKTTESNKKITKGLLKGISVDLLKKIRAKEAANLAIEMTRKPEVETELRILGSLPEIVRIIHSYFIGSNKLSVPYDQLIDKVISSFNASMSIVRAREHVDYLCRLFPEWISLLEVNRGNYIKINKQKNVAALDKRIADKVALLKTCQ